MNDAALKLALQRLTGAAELVLTTLGRGNQADWASKTARAQLTRLQLVTDVASLTLTERGARAARIALGELDVKLRETRAQARVDAETRVTPPSALQWAGWSEGAVEHP